MGAPRSGSLGWVERRVQIGGGVQRKPRGSDTSALEELGSRGFLWSSQPCSSTSPLASWPVIGSSWRSGSGHPLTSTPHCHSPGAAEGR